MDESLAQSHDMLRAFLHAELQLVPTLLGAAHKSLFLGESKAAFQAMHHVDEALDMVERFAGELPAEERSVILQSVAEHRANMKVIRRLAS